MVDVANVVPFLEFHYAYMLTHSEDSFSFFTYGDDEGKKENKQSAKHVADIKKI